MKKRGTGGQKGFSLVELLVAAVILGMVMAGVFEMMSTSIQSFQNTADQGANVQLAREMVNDIANEIRNATLVSLPVFTSGSDSTGTTLQYTYPGTSGNCTVQLGTGADAHYMLKTKGGVTTKLGQGRVVSLQFVRSGADRRVFSVTIVLQSSSGALETPVKTTVTTLNSGT